MAVEGIESRFQPVLDDYRAGLVTNSNRLVTLRGASPLCRNVYATIDGTLRKRRGFEEVNSSALTQTAGNGGLDFGPTTVLGRQQVVQFGTEIRKMDDLDGTFDLLTTGRSDEPMEMVAYTAGGVNYCIMCDGGGLAPLKYDGLNTPSPVHSSAPTAKHPIVFRSRLLMSAISGDRFTIDYTPANSLDFSSGGSFIIDNPESEEPSGWGVLRGNLYAFFPNSIWRISFLGAEPLFSVASAIIGIGTLYPRTIKNIYWKGQEWLVFLGSDDKVYAFDGFGLASISDLIDKDNGLSEISMDLVNPLEGVPCAVIDDARQWYVLYIAKSGFVLNNYALVFDYSGEGAWWPFDNQDFGHGFVATDSLGKQKLMALGYDGKMYEWFVTKNDNGTAIEAEWTSQKLYPNSSMLTRGRGIKLYPAPLGNDTLKFSYRTDLNRTWKAEEDVSLFTQDDTFLGGSGAFGFVLGTSTLGPAAEPVTYLDIDESFNHIEFRLRDDGINLNPWEFQKMEFIGFTTSTARGTEESNSVDQTRGGGV